jgi:hypothetical protein
MPKRPQPSGLAKPVIRESAWSLASNGMTPEGWSELLRELGSQMKDEYQELISEPVPEHLQQLASKLKESG